MIHQKNVKNYKGTLEELAKDVGDLRYDALVEFLDLLSEKLKRDGEKDFSRSRPKLAEQLYICSRLLKESSESINQAWAICKPFMKDDNN